MKLVQLVSIAFCAALLPAVASADTDACTLLTPSQVGAVVGAVGAGAHVTPTFVKTCTWTPSAKSHVTAVTLNVQTAAFYDGGKQRAAMAAAAVKGNALEAAAVGDDAYYFVGGEQVALFVKKGAASFKLAIYATLPVGKKKAMELELAREVVQRL
jgi:hypothetical protein